MDVQSILTSHAINYFTSRFGSGVLDKLLEDIDTSYYKLISMNRRIPYVDIRRLAENIYFFLDEDVQCLYDLGTDFVKCFAEKKEYIKQYPFFSLFRKMPPINEMDESDFSEFIGVTSRINAAIRPKVINRYRNRVDLSMKKTLRFETKNIKFKMNDNKFADIICENHKACFIEFFKLIGTRDLKLEELHHDRVIDEREKVRECVYRFTWSDSSSDGNSDKQIIYNKKQFDIIIKLTKREISLDDLKIIIWRDEGFSYKEMATRDKNVSITTDGIKKRSKKLRDVFGINHIDELIKYFKKNECFDTIKHLVKDQTLQ